METFKDIDGFKGLYQISNKGNVKSLGRTVKNGTGYRRVRERILKPVPNKRGYYQVTLCRNQFEKNVKVHQLVAIYFLGHKPNGLKTVVDHINHDRSDNNVKNLRLVTNRENTSHRKLKSSSQYTGVCWSKSNKHWVSQIRIKGKMTYLGQFKTEYEAHVAYQNKLKQIWEN
jgi:hypothetical protein